VRLEYRVEAGGDSCPSEQHVRDTVAARLGYVPFSGTSSRRVVAVISPAGEGLRAAVRLFNSAGQVEAEQEILSEEADCETLVVSMTRSIANAIDPRLFLTPRPPEEGGPPEPPVEETPLPETPVSPEPDGCTDGSERTESPGPREEPSPRVERRVRLRWNTGGNAFVTVGATPGVSFGGAIWGSVGGEHWSVLLEVRADAPSSAEAADGGSVTMWQLLPTIGGCGRIWWFEGCGLLALGVLHAWGAGADVTRREVVFHAAVGIRAALAIPLTPRFAIEILADLLVPLTPTVLELDGAVLWEMPVVSGAFGLGLRGTFS